MRFRVVGPDAPTSIDASLITAMGEHTVQPPSVGAPPEVQVGFCAGQHVFDHTFDAETIAYPPMLTFGVRFDTNRVPAELRKAYREMAQIEQAKASPTGYLNRAEKVAAREQAEDRCRQEVSEGRHRSSKMMPALWDVSRRLVFAPAFSDVKVSAFSDLFQTAFDARLMPMTAGALARELLEGKGVQRAFEDARPTPFTPPPPTAESAGDDASATDPTRPAVPWAAAANEPNDFLGNEFLIWLWWRTITSAGVIETDAGTVTIVIDHALDMDCAWDATGKQTLRANGPARLPEAVRALQNGKWPRKVGLLVAIDDQEHWSLTLQADRFIYSAVKIPAPDEPASQSPRDEVQRRVDSFTRLDRIMLASYRAFLRQRFAEHWPHMRRDISAWIKAGARSTASGSTTVPDIATAPASTTSSSRAPAHNFAPVPSASTIITEAKPAPTADHHPIVELDIAQQHESADADGAVETVDATAHVAS